MSDWKREAAARRDFRHTHGEPEIARRGRSARRRNTKPWRLTAKWQASQSPWASNRLTLGKYTTEKRAKQARKKHKVDQWFCNFEIERVRGKR